MPVMGPNYSDEQADKATEEVLAFLKEHYSIQKFPSPDPFLKLDYAQDRIERNEKLRKAIHGLFELESWEAW